MLNLNSTIDMDFKSFLRWWRSELSFLVPEKIKRLFNDRQGLLVISTEGTGLVLTYAEGGQAYLEGAGEVIAKIGRNEAGIAHYKTLEANDERLGKANVILRLTGQEAICRELALPAAAKENLYQVVAYELDRYTPFKAEQVYFAVKPIEGANEPGQIKAMLVLTTRECLEGLYEDIKAMGMSPLFADYQGAANRLDQLHDAYDLLPEGLRQKTAKTPRLIHFALMASVALLAAAVLVAPVWLEYQMVNALTDKIKIIEKDAKKIKALQSEIDTVINETQMLIDEKNATPMVVEMLNTLSAIIKDDTWLAYLQYADNHLQIQGESPAASTLIGVLEASELFTKARFVSPVTQNNISKLERFQITVDTTKSGAAHGNP
ncbi:MAG: PilN domain-containing protein [Methylovulum sp.]|nr:PilN domain-containing protein [Methylovulum sp.]